MAEVKPMMVEVEALQPHTAFGESYEVGDTYEIEEQYADSVAYQGKAVRTDRVKVAKAQAAAATKAATKPGKKATKARAKKSK